MRQKLRDALRATASTLLEPGERFEATGRARPGHVSVKTGLAIASASAILSSNAAMYTSLLRKEIYVLLTDRRLIVLEPHWLTFRPTAKVLASMPRPLLVSDVKRGFMTSFVVLATGDANGLQLSFPRTERSDAEAMLTALGAPISMTLSADDFTVSISRPSFRALLITCTAGPREIDVYAEALPDSPDHDWSIHPTNLSAWTRPTTTPLARDEMRALTIALTRRIAAEGLRVRWD